MIRIELVGEPKGKGRHRYVRATGHTYTPAGTRSYEAALRYAAQEAMAGAAPLEGALSLRVEAYLPIPASRPKKWKLQAAMALVRPTTKPDFDNILKTMDALNTVVWRDDAQVVSVFFTKLYSERPRLLVSVWPVTETVKAVAA